MLRIIKTIFITITLTSAFSCGFKTIYGDNNFNNQENSTSENNINYENDFAAIRIKKDRTKLDQDLKNSLYDLLNPDNIKVEPKYFLILKAKTSTLSTFITTSGTPGRNKVFLYVTYELKDLTTGETISTGNVVNNDNYDISNNRYGTYTIDEFVQNNLTKVVAQNIRNSLVNDIVKMHNNKKESNKTPKESSPQ